MGSLTKEEAWLLEEKYGGKETPEFATDKGRLAQGEPAAYVIGHQPFLGLKIYLDSHPLIPRSETEWWTERLLAVLTSPSGESAERFTTVRLGQAARSVGGNRSAGEPLLFLDLCAGSGAVGCAALARLPDAQVYFGEIEPAHEATISKNIRENMLDASRAHIGIGDLFAPFGDLRFDVIAANPPYIPNARELPRSVAQFEPRTALFSGEDGLELMHRIAAELPRHLTPHGVAWVECDAEHAEEARELFASAGLRAELMHDQYECPRVLVLSLA